MINKKVTTGLLLNILFFTIVSGQAVKPERWPGKKNSLNFLVIGDWGRCGEGYQTKVADQLAAASKETDAKFIVSTGDNFYPKGVMSIDDPLWNRSFEDVYHQFSLQKDWYVVLGNHDVKTNPDAEIGYSKKSARWHMPKHYYAIKMPISDKDTTKKILLVFLDTSPFVDKYYGDPDYKQYVRSQDTSMQKRWLIKTLADRDPNIKLCFVFGHHPLFTSGKRINSPETMQVRAALKPIFDKYRVDAYISGHEHDLEYIKPEGHTNYFISGAGSEARPVNGKLPESKFAISDYGFMAFSVTESELAMQIVNREGKVLYKTIIPLDD